MRRKLAEQEQALEAGVQQERQRAQEEQERLASDHERKVQEHKAAYETDLLQTKQQLENLKELTASAEDEKSQLQAEFALKLKEKVKSEQAK